MQFSTSRLTVCALTSDDAPWLLTLNQDPLWLRFIGNRGVHSLADAHQYIARTAAHFDEWNYGLLAVKDTQSKAPLGLCGLINRFLFTCPDLGFALLPEARGRGVAKEASSAVIHWAKDELKFDYLTAMTHPENLKSQQVLTSLAFEKRGKLCIDQEGVQSFYRLNLRG